MVLLNEILNAPSGGGDDFTQEWQAVFGSSAAPPPASADGMADFMPSCLLDMTVGSEARQSTRQGEVLSIYCLFWASHKIYRQLQDGFMRLYRQRQ